MRKNIDIPDEIVKDLKKLAVDADKDLKNYIQDLLVDHVKKSLNQTKNTMKTLFIAVILGLSIMSCGSEDDPKPQYDCEALRAAETNAKNYYQAVIASGSGFSEQEKEEARQAYIDAQKEYNEKCQ